jgi:hypothetical protein
MSKTRKLTGAEEICAWLSAGVTGEEVVRRLVERDGISERRARGRMFAARGYGDVIAVDDDGNRLPDEEQRKLWEQQ